MKICSIVGARPQFVKLAPLSREIRKNHTEIIVHTGQHYDIELSAAFFKELAIPEPDYNLEVGSGTHAHQVGNALIRIEEVLLRQEPDLVLVYGDTNSTLAGALAAAKLNIPLGHVEAGLRSFNKKMPEETNRVLADRVSDHLFCPTETAIKNLANEGIRTGAHLVGDVMYDAILDNLTRAEGESTILKSINLKPKGFYLATVHRAENTDGGHNLRTIVDALQALDLPVIFPLHPRTRERVRSMEPAVPLSNVVFTKPMGYFDMLVLEKNARAILTDSGGVQKEAYFLKVPCITMRNETEWIETVEDGWNLLAGADKEKIVESAKGFRPEGPHRNAFGEGRAAETIAAILSSLTNPYHGQTNGKEPRPRGALAEGGCV